MRLQLLSKTGQHHCATHPCPRAQRCRTEADPAIKDTKSRQAGYSSRDTRGATNSLARARKHPISHLQYRAFGKPARSGVRDMQRQGKRRGKRPEQRRHVSKTIAAGWRARLQIGLFCIDRLRFYRCDLRRGAKGLEQASWAS
jgi:hypothetical protein